MSDFLYPIMNYHEEVRFIKSKKQGELSLRHLKALSRVQLDYLSFNQPLENDHPLIRAIIQMNAVTDDIYRTYTVAQDQVENISSLMRWYNGINTGYPLDHPYFFLDKTTPEVIVSTSFEDSGELVIQQVLQPEKEYYLSWSSVRVKYHCYTDMDYLRMSKTPEAPRIPFIKGINIIEVDLALLFTQYKIWRTKPISAFDETITKTIGQFLTTVVLPNAIESQMQIAYFNRMCAYFTEKPIPSSQRIHKQHAYYNTYQYVDDGILEVLKNYHKSGMMNFNRIIRNLPTLTEEMDYGHHFRYRNSTVFIRRQFIAMHVISVIPLYQIWWYLVKKHQWQKWNTDEIAKIKRGIKFLNNQNAFTKHLKSMGPYLKTLFDEFSSQIR